MFPNNMEFFAKERIAERYAEAEKHRLGQELPKQNKSMLKLKLGQLIHWSGVQLINWGEKLQVQAPIVAAEQPERSIS